MGDHQLDSEMHYHQRANMRAYNEFHDKQVAQMREKREREYEASLRKIQEEANYRQAEIDKRRQQRIAKSNLRQSMKEEEEKEEEFKIPGFDPSDRTPLLLKLKKEPQILHSSQGHISSSGRLPKDLWNF